MYSPFAVFERCGAPSEMRILPVRCRTECLAWVHGIDSATES